MTAIFEPITARSSPGFTRTAPSAAHKGGGGKYANGVTTSKILATNNIFIGIWELNVVNGRPNGKIDASEVYDGKLQRNIGSTQDSQ